jgi:hypothetical protein
MRNCLLLILMLCLLFGWRQNHQAQLGGDISLAKVLWLNLALSCFFVIPAALWREEKLSRPLRLLYGLFFGSFVLRALIEAPMLYVWQNWRCAYGITHDAVMILVLIVALLPRVQPSDKMLLSARRFGWLLIVVLICEALNAWLFSRVADPLHGIYFAADSIEFLPINRITWIEVATLYPALLYWVLHHPREAWEK